MIPPLFPFYGSKWRTATRYPARAHSLVVEPFAGSAGYSLRHEPPEVRLYDVDLYVVEVWDYLIHVSEAELLALPDLTPGESVDGLHVPQQAKWLIGFWLNRGSAQPKRTMTDWAQRHSVPGQTPKLVWGERARLRIAEHLPRIRHWTVDLLSFEQVPQVEATWFVDPPYTVKGRHYRHSEVDYPELATWCRGLPGQAIVCEQAGASWLPFESAVRAKAMTGTSDEVVWTTT